MKRTIRIDETALKEIIAESVKEIMLNEGFVTNMNNPMMRSTMMKNTGNKAINTSQNNLAKPQQRQQQQQNNGNNVLSQLKMLQQQLNQIIAQMS